MAPRLGEGYRTPIPHRDNEARGIGAGPVIKYTMSPEELAKYGPPNPSTGKTDKHTVIPDRSSEEQSRRAKMRYTNQDGLPIKQPVILQDRKRKEKRNMTNQPKDGTPAKVPNKVEFLKLIAEGKSINAAGKAMGLAEGYIYYWIGRWGFKGIKPEQAQQLLDEMLIDGEASLTQPAPVTAPTAEPVIQDEKDAEIQRLRDELAKTFGERNQLQDAAKGAAIVVNQASDRIRELEQERDSYKRAAEDLEAKIIEVPPTMLELVELPEPRAKRSMRIEVTDNQNVIEDELLAVLTYVQAMRGKSFSMELYLGEA